MVDLAVSYYQLCNYVYGIVYEMLKCFIPHMFFDSSASINHVAFRWKKFLDTFTVIPK